MGLGRTGPSPGHPVGRMGSLADILLASLSSDVFFYWRRVREHEIERIAASFDMLVDRLLP